VELIRCLLVRGQVVTPSFRCSSSQVSPHDDDGDAPTGSPRGCSLDNLDGEIM
jgi:hypothetical protein